MPLDTTPAAPETILFALEGSERPEAIKTAHFLAENISPVGAVQRHYRIEGGTPAYIIVSATVVDFTGHEVLIFAADAEGAVTSSSDLPGSCRGTLDHEEALRHGGYEIAAVAS